MLESKGILNVVPRFTGENTGAKTVRAQEPPFVFVQGSVQGELLALGALGTAGSGCSLQFPPCDGLLPLLCSFL